MGVPPFKARTARQGGLAGPEERGGGDRRGREGGLEGLEPDRRASVGWEIEELDPTVPVARDGGIRRSVAVEVADGDVPREVVPLQGHEGSLDPPGLPLQDLEGVHGHHDEPVRLPARGGGHRRETERTASLREMACPATAESRPVPSPSR